MTSRRELRLSTSAIASSYMCSFRAMAFLQQCDLLKIEDILPFFPDFVLIDDFKDEICSALEEYNIHIEDLKTEMDEATKSAESIRLDIRELKSRFAVINAVEKCYLCQFPLLTRQFYIFPCQHAFHADCLVNRTSKYLPTRQIRRLANLQEQLSRELRQSKSPQPESSMVPVALRGAIFSGGDTETKKKEPSSVARAEQLKEELDDIVASECVLCGDIMIKSIDQPFIGDDETDVVASWAI